MSHKTEVCEVLWVKVCNLSRLKCHSELIHNTVLKLHRNMHLRKTWRDVPRRLFQLWILSGPKWYYQLLMFSSDLIFFFFHDCDNLGFPAVTASLTRESSLYNKDTVDSCQSFHRHKPNLFRLLIGFWIWNKSFFFQPSSSNLNVLHHRKMGESYIFCSLFGG